ncbi:MAG TPA: NUDIX hydrolase [Promineifilum sp.]|nr:NUDIX hydrolase [Promineifilum sp.]HQF70531.1 NUDIX hydrolase [Promineifilum sp.]
MTHWLNKQDIYDGKIIRVSRAETRLAGQVQAFDIVSHHGGAAVVPWRGDCVLLVRQQRPVVDEALLEIPAGKLESADDDPAARAQAELGEEIGYHAGRLVPVATFYVSPGYCTERIAVFLGLDLEPTEANPEATEDIEIVEMPLDEARQMLDEGRFRDAKTIIGLRELLAYLAREEQL